MTANSYLQNLQNTKKNFKIRLPKDFLYFYYAISHKKSLLLLRYLYMEIIILVLSVDGARAWLDMLFSNTYPQPLICTYNLYPDINQMMLNKHSNIQSW